MQKDRCVAPCVCPALIQAGSAGLFDRQTRICTPTQPNPKEFKLCEELMAVLLLIYQPSYNGDQKVGDLLCV